MNELALALKELMERYEVSLTTYEDASGTTIFVAIFIDNSGSTCWEAENEDFEELLAQVIEAET